jgi:hypothetical protein
MSISRPLSCWAIALCCVGAVAQPFTPLWVPVLFITPAMVLIVIGLGVVQRDWSDVNEAIDLQQCWHRERMRCRPGRASDVEKFREQIWGATDATRDD